MSGATVTADPAQTSDRTAAQACRILAVAARAAAQRFGADDYADRIERLILGPR